MRIKIGTRGSKLAMVQAGMLAAAVCEKFPQTAVEYIRITTKGDRIPDKPLPLIGGSGLFANEIESALLKGEIDIAVHSAKDLPIKLAEGLTIGGVLKRGDPRDAMVTEKKLAPNFRVGTSSVRRSENIKKLYPDAICADIRGNVDTRISKLKSGDYDAVILAYAGLERLGITKDSALNIIPFDTAVFTPAPCQGIIAAECRKNTPTEHILNEINDDDTYKCFETERAVLANLNAGCSTPLGAVSYVNGANIALTVSMKKTICATAPLSERFELAKRLTEEL